MIRRHHRELKWIKFHPIFIIFNVYDAYCNECEIVSNWFEIIFITNYFSIMIYLFMQCILVIWLSNHYIMYVLLAYFCQSMQHLSISTIAANSITPSCCIITYNKNNNYEFFGNKKIEKMLHVAWLFGLLTVYPRYWHQNGWISIVSNNFYYNW